MIFEQEIAVMAANQLGRVIDQIQDSQWDMQMPPDFKASATQRDMTLRDVINYHTYDDAWIPDMLDGKTMDEVGSDNWKGDLLGADPKAKFNEFKDSACAAIEKLDDPERIVHCSFGDYTAQQYLWQVCSFRGLRSYDLAKALGLNTTLPDDLVEGLWRIIEPNAEEWRSYGVYGPAIPVPDDAPLQKRLLGITGYE